MTAAEETERAYWDSHTSDGRCKYPRTCEAVHPQTLAAITVAELLALQAALEHAEAERDRLRERQESHDLANEAIRWKRRAHQAEARVGAVRGLVDYAEAHAHPNVDTRELRRALDSDE